MLYNRHWSDWAGFAFFSAIAAWQLGQYHSFNLIFMPLFMYPVVIGVTFLLRRPLVAKMPGILPTLAGYASTFESTAFFLFAQYVRPDWITENPNNSLRVIGFSIWLVALALDLCVVWFLRDSFSIEPQARKLITSGPFRFARHPLYGVYALQHLGLLLRFNTLPMLVVVLTWLVMTMIRIRFEERVLTAAFPQYKDYRRRVWMFTPSLRPSEKKIAVASGTRVF
jgi:protein-S-isoprenylcysteine O-methyltransferase Ste14